MPSGRQGQLLRVVALSGELGWTWTEWGFEGGAYPGPARPWRLLPGAARALGRGAARALGPAINKERGVSGAGRSPASAQDNVRPGTRPPQPHRLWTVELGPAEDLGAGSGWQRPTQRGDGLRQCPRPNSRPGRSRSDRPAPTPPHVAGSRLPWIARRGCRSPRAQSPPSGPGDQSLRQVAPYTGRPGPMNGGSGLWAPFILHFRVLGVGLRCWTLLQVQTPRPNLQPTPRLALNQPISVSCHQSPSNHGRKTPARG